MHIEEPMFLNEKGICCLEIGEPALEIHWREQKSEILQFNLSCGLVRVWLKVALCQFLFHKEIW